jgi:Leucine-rich repeat (LRR) protein
MNFSTVLTVTFLLSCNLSLYTSIPLTASQLKAWNITEDVIFADLSSYNITEIAQNVFFRFKNLEELWLNDNDLAELDTARAFNGLDSLKVLRLDRNRITSLGRNPFLNLKNLNRLDLSYNRLKSVRFSVDKVNQSIFFPS